MTTGSSARWLGADRAEMAADHILDAAGELFSERGVTSVSMRDVAERAGCSRATLYRYFPGRDDLHLAYVARAAGILAERIDDAVRGPADASTTPADEPERRARLVGAVVMALDGVRADPALASWFADDAAGMTARLAMISPVIETVTIRILHAVVTDDIADADLRARAHWVVRAIVSLLIAPDEPGAEREMLERFVVPAVFGPGTGAPL